MHLGVKERREKSFHKYTGPGHPCSGQWGHEERDIQKQHYKIRTDRAPYPYRYKLNTAVQQLHHKPSHQQGSNCQRHTSELHKSGIQKEEQARK